MINRGDKMHSLLTHIQVKTSMIVSPYHGSFLQDRRCLIHTPCLWNNRVPTHSQAPSIPLGYFWHNEKKQTPAFIYQVGYNEVKVFFLHLMVVRVVLESRLVNELIYSVVQNYVSHKSLRVSLLKAAKETPMLSRAAQKGVSTWVVEQLSHVITALAVSVTPIT